MKRLWLSILVSFIAIPLATESICQIKQQDSQATQDSKIELLDIKKGYVLDIYGGLVGSSWILGIGYGKPEYKPKSYRDVEKDLDDWFQKCKTEKLRKDVIDENILSVKYEANIRKLFRKLRLIGGELAMFLYADKIPLGFVKKDNEVGLLVHGIGSSNVYNTLRTSSKTRAGKIIGSIILPLMNGFQDALGDTVIRHYGMIIGYGSKDFADPYLGGSLKSEVVIFIVSAENCRKFSEGVITDDEFINASEIYLQDRDMKDFKRIRVTLE
jgi:hypothetical protein